MAGFIQLIEIQTSRMDEIRALVDEYRASRSGDTMPRRVTVTQDRDANNSYIQIVEFDSFETAMANSENPETSAFAERLAKLCDGPPTFRNLDVVSSEEIG